MDNQYTFAALLNRKVRKFAVFLIAVLSIGATEVAFSTTDARRQQLLAVLPAILMLLQDECVDEDKDSLCDEDEIKYFGDIFAVNDANADEDGDGLSNGRELNHFHSDPTSQNTDGDLLSDYEESLVGTNLSIAFDNGGTLGGDSVVDRSTIHILNRLTFGPTQTELEQVAAAGGIDNWIAEQLVPIGLPPVPPRDKSKVAPVYGYEDDVYPLPYDCSHHVTPDPAQAMRDCFVSRNEYMSGTIRPMHSNKQLQARMAMFWDNHFNTDVVTHGRGMAELSDEDNWFVNAFGSFKGLLMLNAKNATMLQYLNLDNNIKSNPNENFPREVMELHSVGIDGGYGDEDIVQLANILTGWEHKKVTDLEGKCTDTSNIISCGSYVSRYGYPKNAKNDLDIGDGGSGETGLEKSTKFDPVRIFRFNINDHDDGLVDWDGNGTINATKTLSWPYKGTTYSKTIVSRSGPDGQIEGEEALDFLATHPATADFICKKLAQEFVSDTPREATLESCANTFLTNTHSNRQMGLVLANLLASAEFNAPSTQRSKLKDTQEVLFSLARILGWKAVYHNLFLDYHRSVSARIRDAEQALFRKDTPTGYYETADNWLDTNIILNRFQAMNDMSFDDDQTQSFVKYFNRIGKTSSRQILSHLFLIMLGGQYDEDDVKMGLELLHKVNPGDESSGKLQAFNLNDPTDRLMFNLNQTNGNGLPDVDDRIRALIARLAALPEFQLH